MPRVLITGAAGFIGMHTSIKFLKEGWDVIGLDNLNEYYSIALKKDRVEEILRSEKIEPGNFRMYEEDLNSDIWEMFSKIKWDLVIHLAAQAGVRYSIENPSVYVNSNILGFQNVIDFVAQNKIQRFLYASSSSVYGNSSNSPFSESQNCNSPESYYAATKRANELMAYSYFKTKKLSSIGMRFFTVYGPWGRPDMAPVIFTRKALSSEPIEVYNYGNQKRDFTYIEDIVEAIFRLSKSSTEKGAHLYNIGAGSPVNLGDFIRLLELELKIEIKKEFLPEQIGDVRETYADISKLKKDTGFKPEFTLELGIKNFISWYKDYYEHN